MIDVSLLHVNVPLLVEHIGNDLLTADRASVMLLPDPPVETYGVEDVLRMALERCHMVLHLEVIQTDGARCLTFVSHGVVVLARQCRRYLLDLTVELSFPGLQLVVLHDGMRHDVNVGKCVSDLDISHI